MSGYDLYGYRDLCALAVPEFVEERVGVIAIFATLATDEALWQRALPNLECIELDEVTGLVGAPVKVARRKPYLGELVDLKEATVGGEPVEVSIFRRPRRKAIEPEERSDRYRLFSLPWGTIRLLLAPEGQIYWDPEFELATEQGFDAA